MAATNDLMFQKLAVTYGAGKSLGDYLKLFAADHAGFAGAAQRAWYATALDAIPVAYAANATLGDLANLYWASV